MVALRIKSNNVLRNIMSDKYSHNDESEPKPFTKTEVRKLEKYDTYDSTYDQPRNDTIVQKESIPSSTGRKTSIPEGFSEQFSTSKKQPRAEFIQGTKESLNVEFPETTSASQFKINPNTKEDLKKTFLFTKGVMEKGGSALGRGIIGTSKFLAGRDPEYEAQLEDLKSQNQRKERDYADTKSFLTKEFGVTDRKSLEAEFKRKEEESKRAESDYFTKRNQYVKKHGTNDEAKLMGFLTPSERQEYAQTKSTSAEKGLAMNKLKEASSSLKNLESEYITSRKDYETKRTEMPKQKPGEFAKFANKMGTNMGANMGGFMGSFENKGLSEKARYAQMGLSALERQYKTTTKTSNTNEMLSKLSAGQLTKYMRAKQQAQSAIGASAGAGFMGGEMGKTIIGMQSRRPTQFKEFTQVGRSGPPELGMFSPETSGRFNVNQGLRAEGQNKIASILGKGPDTGMSPRDKLKRFI